MPGLFESVFKKIEQKGIQREQQTLDMFIGPEATEVARTTYDKAVEAAVQAIQAGANPEELMPLREVAGGAAVEMARVHNARLQAAIKRGLDVQGSQPITQEQIDQKLASFDAQVLASTPNPVRVGEQAAEQQMAEARRLAQELNVPVEKVAQAMGITPEAAVPNVVNFQRQDGSLVAVDISAPDGGQKVNALVNEGAVRIGLNVNAGTPSDLSFTADEVHEFREAEIASTIAVNEIGRLREQLGGADLRTGLVGGVVRGLDTVASQMVQVAKTFGFDEAGLLDPTKYDLTGFGPEAQSSAVFRSNLINMFYVMARSQEPGGRALTEGDIQRQADRFAATGSTTQMAAALDEIERSIKEGFAVRHQIFSRNVDVGPIPEALQPQDQGVDLDVLAAKGEENLTDEDLAGLSREQLIDLAKMLGKTVQ